MARGKKRPEKGSGQRKEETREEKSQERDSRGTKVGILLTLKGR